jgi:hypothetical protein
MLQSTVVAVGSVLLTQLRVASGVMVIAWFAVAVRPPLSVTVSTTVKGVAALRPVYV